MAGMGIGEGKKCGKAVERGGGEKNLDPHFVTLRYKQEKKIRFYIKKKKIDFSHRKIFSQINEILHFY